MGFSWAYINCDEIAGSGSEGPAWSLQFVTESGGATTGSHLFSYYTASRYSYDPSTLVLSGNLIITGAISASTYHIDDIAIIDATGSTFFGDDQTDLHVRTGSMEIYKNSDSLVYKFDAVNTKLGVGTEPSAPVHIYKAAAGGDHTPMELLRLEQQDEGVDMSAGHGPAIKAMRILLLPCPFILRVMIVPQQKKCESPVPVRSASGQRLHHICSRLLARFQAHLLSMRWELLHLEVRWRLQDLPHLVMMFLAPQRECSKLL
jgi:hypothetical protein